LGELASNPVIHRNVMPMLLFLVVCVLYSVLALKTIYSTAKDGMDEENDLEKADFEDL
jgi:hypothetical protein